MQDEADGPRVDRGRDGHRLVGEARGRHLGRRVAHGAVGDGLLVVLEDLVEIDEPPLAVEAHEVLRLQVGVHEALVVQRHDALQHAQRDVRRAHMESSLIWKLPYYGIYCPNLP
eukprot:768894-Prymnesium_polylepis.2